MASINPYTLETDTPEDQEDRFVVTGEISDGKTVICRPYLDEPDIVRHQHRVVCLFQRYPACPLCPHNSFSLFFNNDPSQRYEVVACPRWNLPGGQILGQAPDVYVPTELAKCEEKPYEFCPSCPQKSELVLIGLDKRQPGWFGRWTRLRREELEDERAR